MAEIILSQAEADALIALEKHRVSDTSYAFPALGGYLEIPLVSFNGRDQFTLDIARGRIKLTKATYQNRTRTVIVLLRLDIDGPPHTNPNDEEIPCPHLHTYREGYGINGPFRSPRYSMQQETCFKLCSILWNTRILRTNL